MFPGVVGAHEVAGLAEAQRLATAKVSDAAFEVELRHVGSYKAGQVGTAEVVLRAKGNFKVNDKYPFKFEFAPVDGVKPAKQVVGADAIALGKKHAVMTLRFTPQQVGKATLEGQFKFSVCTDDRCLVERQDLALRLDVE